MYSTKNKGYVKIINKIPDYRNHLNIPEGAIAKIIQYKFDSSFAVLEYKGTREVMLLSSEDTRILPDGEEKVVRLLYGN